MDRQHPPVAPAQCQSHRYAARAGLWCWRAAPGLCYAGPGKWQLARRGAGGGGFTRPGRRSAGQCHCPASWLQRSLKPVGRRAGRPDRRAHPEPDALRVSGVGHQGHELHPPRRRPARTPGKRPGLHRRRGAVFCSLGCAAAGFAQRGRATGLGLSVAVPRRGGGLGGAVHGDRAELGGLV